MILTRWLDKLAAMLIARMDLIDTSDAAIAAWFDGHPLALLAESTPDA